MIKPAIPSNEAERLAALYDYQLLDSDDEAAFDDLAQLAASMLDMPSSAVSLIDTDRQWFKASVNVPAKQTGRDVSFCGHTILGDDLLIVPDAALDPRFADNPLRQQLGIRFYAGTPLRDPQGLAIGSLCVLDRKPRELTASQQQSLRALGRQVEGQMNLRRTMRTIAASERFARSTIDALGTHIAILDHTGKIVTTNLAWRESAGEPSLAAVGETGSSYVGWCNELDSDDALRLVGGIRCVTVGEQAHFAMEYEVELQGQRKWFLARVSRFGGLGPIRVVVSHESVTDRRAATEQLFHDARHDALTGLPNRLNFMEQIERSLKSATRTKARFAVLFLDLDRFKLINDSLGHSAGDVVLQVIADRIQSCLRSCDTVARMGGDEFTILIEQMHQPTDAARLARRIGEALALPIEYQGNELQTTASIGIVSFGGSGQAQTALELLRDADAAMYKAKAGGRDQFVLFDAAMHREVVTRMRLETDLRKAIARGELELHYQPILKLREKTTCGFEALVRWRRNDVLVSPAQFIPVAEDTGLIVAIGNWVLRQACWQLARWRENPSMRDLYITVNVSRKQLTNPQLLPTLQDVLIETGLPPQAVVLEITETALMENSTAAMAMMQQLRNVGVRLSIDDFGTGYSSLSCLQEFPIDLLKIDRSFVENMKDSRQAAVIRTIIELAHQLQMTVVAEGVETPDQALRLEQCGCDLTQGYLFAKPLTADAAATFAAVSSRAA